MRDLLREMIQQGYVIKEDMDLYEGSLDADVLGMLYLGEPHQRTIAVRILAKKGMTEETSARLLEILEKEKSFYTRLEIEASLKKGNAGTAELVAKKFRKTQRENCKSCKLKQESAIPRETLLSILNGIGAASILPLLGVLREKEEGLVEGAASALKMILKNQGVYDFPEAERIIIESFHSNIEEKAQLEIVNLLSVFNTYETIQFLSEIKQGAKFSTVRAEAGKAILKVHRNWMVG